MVTDIWYKIEGKLVLFLHLKIVLDISGSWDGNLVCHGMQFVLFLYHLKPADPEFDIRVRII